MGERHLKLLVKFWSPCGPGLAVERKVKNGQASVSSHDTAGIQFELRAASKQLSPGGTHTASTWFWEPRSKQLATKHTNPLSIGKCRKAYQTISNMYQRHVTNKATNN